MARRSDESGVPNTCPFIDEAIQELGRCECDHVQQGDATLALEKVRSFNDELRTWGNTQYSELQDAEKQIERLESENDDLRAEIKSLLSDIKELEAREI